jgi:hypothetical protein
LILLIKFKKSNKGFTQLTAIHFFIPHLAKTPYWGSFMGKFTIFFQDSLSSILIFSDLIRTGRHTSLMVAFSAKQLSQSIYSLPDFIAVASSSEYSSKRK